MKLLQVLLADGPQLSGPLGAAAQRQRAASLKITSPLAGSPHLTGEGQHPRERRTSASVLRWKWASGRCGREKCAMAWWHEHQEYLWSSWSSHLEISEMVGIDHGGYLWPWQVILRAMRDKGPLVPTIVFHNFKKGTPLSSYKKKKLGLSNFWWSCG